MKVCVLIEEVHGYYNDYTAVRGVFSNSAKAEEGKAKLLFERQKKSIGYSSEWEIEDFEIDGDPNEER